MRFKMMMAGLVGAAVAAGLVFFGLAGPVREQPQAGVRGAPPLVPPFVPPLVPPLVPRGLAFFDRVEAQSGPPRPVAAPEAALWRGMDAALRSATSMRAFFYYAMRRPQEGGYYYAMQAISACSKTAEAMAAAVSPQRQQAAALLHARCDFTAEDRDDAQRQFGAIRGLNFEDDPLLRVMLQPGTPGDRDSEAGQLRRIIELGNPDVSAAVLTARMEADLGSAFGRNDVALSDNIGYAQVLIACRLGAECSRGSPYALKLCAQRGWCGDDLPSALRYGLGERFERLDQISAAIVADVRKGDYAALWVDR